jgi:hypothetical protein
VPQHELDPHPHVNGDIFFPNYTITNGRLVQEEKVPRNEGSSKTVAAQSKGKKIE